MQPNPAPRHPLLHKCTRHALKSTPLMRLSERSSSARKCGMSVNSSPLQPWHAGHPNPISGRPLLQLASSCACTVMALQSSTAPFRMLRALPDRDMNCQNTLQPGYRGRAGGKCPVQHCTPAAGADSCGSSRGCLSSLLLALRGQPVQKKDVRLERAARRNERGRCEESCPQQPIDQSAWLC